MLEILNPRSARGCIRHALFDFDGTLSLIREGWQDVMIPMMVELLRQTPGAEDAARIETVVREFVSRLTGKQTIYQMPACGTVAANRPARRRVADQTASAIAGSGAATVARSLSSTAAVAPTLRLARSAMATHKSANE